MKPVLTTIQPGEVRVNDGSFYIEAQGDTVVAIYGDLHTKRAGMCGSSFSPDDGPGICLAATPDSLKTDDERRGTLTFITFPEFKGWSVHCADVARYTVSVCLVKLKS